MATSTLKSNNLSLHIETLTASSITISGNSGKNGEIAIPSVTGYKPIGLIGWECNTWEVAPSKLNTVVGGAKVWYSLANASTSSKTVDFSMKVLYVPTSWTV